MAANGGVALTFKQQFWLLVKGEKASQWPNITLALAIKLGSAGLKLH